MRLLGCAVGSVLVVGVGMTAGAAGESDDAPASGAALKQRLEASGLAITYREGKPRDESLTVIGGVARGRRGGHVGFEFVVDEDGDTSTDELGTIGFPIEFKARGPWIDPIVRGVLKNVAYANYFLGRGSGDREDMLVVRRLDDSLFGLFPPDDAEAHPILADPPD